MESLRSQELRIGNYIKTIKGIEQVVDVMCDCVNTMQIERELYENIEPIPLTEELAIKLGGEKLNFPNILNSIIFDIGRNRILSLGNVGTGNEMLWICELNPLNKKEITDLVCIHNFDYNGRLMAHQLQNIYFAITREELTINN